MDSQFWFLDRRRALQPPSKRAALRLPLGSILHGQLLRQTLHANNIANRHKPLLDGVALILTHRSHSDGHVDPDGAFAPQDAGESMATPCSVKA
jgi:hypothetical protein